MNAANMYTMQIIIVDKFSHHDMGLLRSQMMETAFRHEG
jgi:hypothetical protein